MRLISLFLLAISLSGGTAHAADLFPLRPGAIWEYRAEGVREPLVIKVGTELYTDGRTYSRLTGYVDRPLWVRLKSDGNLYYLDEETTQDHLLTMFAVEPRMWFNAPFRPCEQEGQAHTDQAPYSGLTGPIDGTVEIQYRSYGCADAGVETEQYAANIGMVSRTVSTIAGPVVYKLVYADTGALTLAPRTSVTLRLALERNGDEPRLTARLRLSGESDVAPKLVFNTSQEFDVLLRDASGTVRWKWSDGQAFTTGIHQKLASNLAYEVEIPLEQAGSGLPGGDYTVEAWITTADAERAPRAIAAYHLEAPTQTRSAVRPMRARR